MIPLVLVAIAAFYYQFDDELRPEVVEIINYKPINIKIENNGYYALLGMFANEEDDPHVKGRHIASEAKKKYNGEDYVSVVFASEVEGAVAIEPNVDKDVFCDSVSGPKCVVDIDKRREYYGQLIRENEILINRLRKIYKYQYYLEDSNIVVATDIVSMQKLISADITYKWLNGRHETALRLLRDDLNYWRLVSNSDITLITRMIATVGIERNYQLLNELVSNCTKCIDEDFLKENLLRPITGEELDMSKVFDSELRYMYYNVIANIKKMRTDSFWEKVTLNSFLKPNSVMNRLYGVYSSASRLSKCEIENYKECQTAYMDEVGKGIKYLSLEFVKDPVGDIFFHMAKPHYHKYVWSGYSKELTRRLIYAKYLLYENEIPESNIQEFLNHLPADFMNPITGRAIEWDTESRSLKMRLPEKMQVVDVSIEY